MNAQIEAKVMMLRNLSLVTFLKETFLFGRKTISCHFFNLNVKVKLFFNNLYNMCAFDIVTYIQVGLKLLLILNNLEFTGHTVMYFLGFWDLAL